jgi:chromosome transmission fidelity protein 1
VDEGDMLDVKYSNNENGNINQDVPISKHVSCMSLVESFMTTLTFSEVQGKIIAEWPAKDGTGDHRQRFLCQPRFRYVLLNPAAHFKDIVKNAHAVVLTAGTLRPFSHVAQELLSSEKNIVTEAIAADRLCDEERQNISSTFNGSYLTAFTCSHVVPSSNVHLRCISYGNSGTELDFRHNSKYRDDVCDTLAECLVEIFNISPEGVVVFLPSYSYEAYLFRRWKSSGILSAMNQKKTIYREPSSARDLEGILESYSKEARSKKGAALFCVIGGKMSEGINFSDEKAR